MPFISISIDIIGSTDAKAKLLGHSSHIGTKATDLYESFQKQVLRVEETFWTMLRSSNLDINRLFLIKNIGDEVWYTYDLEELEEYERRAVVARMIESLVALQTKHFDLVAGPPEDPWNWRDVDPNTLMRIDLSLKITMDVITDALEVASVREKYLAPHVASLLSPLKKPTRFVKAGDDRYINLCNRLGIANQVKTKEKVLSSIRSDYIGWEIDRFFRLRKAAIKGTVLVGPNILSDFESNKLIVSTDTENQTKPGWTISNINIRLCCGQHSFTSLGGNYKLAKRYLPADELKGIGEGCEIGVVYWKYQQDVELNFPYAEILKKITANKTLQRTARTLAVLFGKLCRRRR